MINGYKGEELYSEEIIWESGNINGKRGYSKGLKERRDVKTNFKTKDVRSDGGDGENEFGG